jgi:hypothetical protein
MNNLDFFDDFDVGTSYDSEGRLLTTEQEKFFANSKCVDSGSRLLVLYHASNNDFDTFDIKRAGSGGGCIYGKGFYFCDNSFGLEIYGKFIKEYYLNLKNPYRWEMPEGDEDYYNIDTFIEMLEQNNFVVSDKLRTKLEIEVLENDGGLDTLIELTCGFDLAQKYFIRAGYDGIMNLEIGDYVAFKPEQIKLCSNKTPAASADVAA